MCDERRFAWGRRGFRGGEAERIRGGEDSAAGEQQERGQPSISRTSPARGPLPDSSGVNSTR